MTDDTLFPTEMATFSLDEQIECIERELRMRLRVYGRLVSEKKMLQAKADHELGAMRAVLTHLKSIKENPNAAT
jgi:hypothetical protein